MKSTPTMKIVVIITFTLCLNYIRCNVNDYITTDVQVLPPFETIIFSDLVDVINEFNDNLKSGFESNVSNDSEERDSSENVVSNYQSFLDKTRKSIINLKETDISNTVKPHNNYNSRSIKFSPRLYPFMSETLYPYKNKMLTKTDKRSKITPNDSCYCKDNVFPCKCVASFNTAPKSYESNSIVNPYGGNYDVKNNFKKDDVNINVNVNVKIPDLIETLTNIISKIFKEYRTEDNFSAKDRHFPTSYMQKYLNYNKKQIIVPKKVSESNKNNRRLNKAGRRHKNKSHLPVNILEMNAVLETKYPTENITNSNNIKDNIDMDKNFTLKNVNHTLSISQNVETNNSIVIPNNETASNVNTTGNNTEPTDDVIFNFSSKIVIGNTSSLDFQDFQKLENSIENFDVTKTEKNKLRHRRQIETVDKKIERNKDNFKLSTNDDRLLYWPPCNSINNLSAASNNISNQSISVLPIQKELIERNITNNKILADKIDINGIARQFVHFVGKYLNGILTLCSESACHSINCINKTCFERVCKPQEKFNAKGHCTTKHCADAAVAVSVNDVPLTKAHKLIDDLRSKTSGKLFGKATLCETQKCVTFAATEKTFLKSSCIPKELTAKGHCPNTK